MFYLGIDQHKRQLTVNLRGEDGSVVLKRQVSTEWEKVRAFFAGLAEKSRPEGGFLALLEVCGMNPWLLDMLKLVFYSRPEFFVVSRYLMEGKPLPSHLHGATEYSLALTIVRRL